MPADSAPNSTDSLTEEDARAAVTRWLVNLGLRPQQLRLETTFPIRVGHLARDVDGAPLAKDGTLRPRCDLLILVNEHVIAIAEVKKPGATFTQADREQALSYARLTQPMAPLTFLTDGVTWECLMTATGHPYSADLTHTILGLSKGILLPEFIAPRPSDLMRALRFFLQLDRTNSRDFAAAQRGFRAKGLVAPDGMTPDAALGRYKHLPTVYVERQIANQHLKSFLEQDAAIVLPILSDAGLGKTSFLLDRAAVMSTDHLVFFLNGATLSSNPLVALREDLHWAGIAIDDDVSFLNALIELLATSQRLVIVIDAIDECFRREFSRELDELVGRLERFNGSVRLIVSCKQLEWPRFEYLGGTQSRIAATSFAAESADAVSRVPLSAGVKLHRFTREETWLALTRMSTWIGRDLEPLPDDLWKQCRTPYFLHMLARVRLDARNWPPAHLSTNPTNLHSLFFSDIARRIDPEGRPEWSESLIVKVANKCWRAATATSPLPADLTDLRGTDNDAKRLLGLLDRGILQGSLNAASFYFQPLFFWIVADRVLHLPNLTPDELAEFAQTIGHSILGGELLHQYLARAPDQQLASLYKDVEGRARLYLATRDDLVRRHFTGLAHMLEPFSDQPGLLLARASSDYAFVQRQAGEAPVIVVDSLDPTPPEEFAGRITSVRSKFPGWERLDPDAIALTELLADVTAIADVGAWQIETQASLEELIRALWRCLNRKFGDSCVANESPLPILDCQHVISRGLYWYAFEYYQSVGLYEALGFQPQMCLKYQGGLIGVPDRFEDRRHLTNEDLGVIAQRAKELASTGVRADRQLQSPSTRAAEACATLIRACEMYSTPAIPGELISAYRYKHRALDEDVVVREMERIAMAAGELVGEIWKESLPNVSKAAGWDRAVKLYVDGGRYQDEPDFDVVTAKAAGGITVIRGASPEPDWAVDCSRTRRTFDGWAYGFSRNKPCLWWRTDVDDSIKRLRDFTPIRNVAHESAKQNIRDFVRVRGEDEIVVLAAWASDVALRRESPFCDLNARSFLNGHNREVWRCLEKSRDLTASEMMHALGQMVDDHELMLGTREAIRGLLSHRQDSKGIQQQAAYRLVQFQDALEA